mmetsp:Transcript_2113/g.2706  ORF Transcript_2113/g.2706 Transcript_2113/m.2706 type:complete len:97 (-) Transcript_2113:983-1273(-)
MVGQCDSDSCHAKISPFGKSCVSLCGQSVRSDAKLTISLYRAGIPHLDYGFFMFVGLLLLWSAKSMSEKTSLYYISGVSLGNYVNIYMHMLIFMKS